MGPPRPQVCLSHKGPGLPALILSGGRPGVGGTPVGMGLSPPQRGEICPWYAPVSSPERLYRNSAHEFGSDCVATCQESCRHPRPRTGQARTSCAPAGLKSADAPSVSDVSEDVKPPGRPLPGRTSPEFQLGQGAWPHPPIPPSSCVGSLSIRTGAPGRGTHQRFGT